MDSEGLSFGGVWLRFFIALLLVYATYNPTTYSYFHWAILPLFGATKSAAGQAGGPVALKFVLGVALVIGWVVYLQATRRSLGLFGSLLALALGGGLIWLLIDFQVFSPTSVGAITHIALIIISLTLAAGVSWSHFTRRWTGQIDTDEIAP